MKKNCTSQVWPVIRSSNVCFKVIDTLQYYCKFIKNFRIVSLAASKGSEGREFDWSRTFFLSRSCSNHQFGQLVIVHNTVHLCCSFLLTKLFNKRMDPFI